MLNRHLVARTKRLDDFIDQNLGCRCPGRKPYRLNALQSAPVNLGVALNELRVSAAGFRGYLDQAF